MKIFFKKAVLFAVTVFSMASCSSKNSENGKVEADAFKDYHIDLASDLTPLGDFLDDVEITVLEETPKSLFGYIHRFAVADDGYFVVSSERKSVIRFDKEGRYVSSFEHKGAGPEEYEIVDDILLKEDQLLLLDSKRRRVTKWTKQGEFSGYQKLNFEATHLQSFSDVYLFDNNYKLVEDSIFANVVVADKEFKTEKALIPFSKSRNLLIENDVVFQKVGENIHYRPAYDDTMFQISPDFSIKPIYHFDFGDYWKYEGNALTDEGMFDVYDNLNEEQEAMIFFNMIENEHLIMGSAVLLPSQRAVGVLINKSSDHISYLDFQLGDDVGDCITLEKVIGDRIYSQVTYAQLERLMSDFPNLKISLKGVNTLEEALSSENPMVFSFKIKN